jgi:elongation factor Ts
MSITANQVNDLRKRTGVSMMQCKKALQETNGDEEKAIEILRKAGAAKAAEKADRDTNEGMILTKVEGNKAAIVKLGCETDFVAKNKEFVTIGQKALEIALTQGADAAMSSQQDTLKELFTKLGENMSIEVKVLEGEGLSDYVHGNGKVGSVVNLSTSDTEKGRDIAMQVTAMNPAVIYPEEVSDELVAKEKEIWKEQMTDEGKSEDIMEKIMMGKEKKFRAESALMKQAFVKDGEKTVETYLDGNTVTEFVRMGV